MPVFPTLHRFTWHCSPIPNKHLALLSSRLPCLWLIHGRLTPSLNSSDLLDSFLPRSDPPSLTFLLPESLIRLVSSFLLRSYLASLSFTLSHPTSNSFLHHLSFPCQTMPYSLSTSFTLHPSNSHNTVHISPWTFFYPTLLHPP